MATATQYDQYEDVGLAFSTEEVTGFDAKDWMRTHLVRLVEQMPVFLRRKQLEGLDHPWISWEIVRKLGDKVSWSCTTALEMPINDVFGVAAVSQLWEALPDPKTPEGKALTKKALDVVPRDWLVERREMLEADMRWIVTIMRRQNAVLGSAGKPVSKSIRRWQNKYVHCLYRELAQVRTLIENYDKQPRKNGEAAPDSQDQEEVVIAPEA